MAAINMPQRTESAIPALMSIVNAYSNWNKNSGENALNAQKTLGQTQQNTADKIALDASQNRVKDLNTPGSQGGEEYKKGLAASLSLGSQAFPVTDPNAQSYLKDTISKLNDSNPKNPDGSPNPNYITGFQAQQNIAGSPFLASIKGLGDENIKAKGELAVAMLKGEGPADRNLGTLSNQYVDTLHPYVQTQNDIKRLDSIFNTKDANGKTLITKQQMADANMAISRLYSPNHMSDSTMGATEYESAPSVFAGALQKYSADPTDIGSRMLIQHMVDQGHHLANVSNQNALAELDNLDPKIASISEPNVQKGIRAISQSYRKRFGVTYPTMGDSSSSQGDLPMPTQAQAQALIKQRAAQKAQK